MIKRVRLKFICIAMSSVGIIFCLMLLAINISMTVSTRRQAAAILERVVEDNGRPEFSKEPSGENGKPAETKMPKKSLGISNIKRTFAVRLDEAGAVTDIIDNGSASFTEDEIKEMAEKIWSGGNTRGMVEKHQYLVKKTSYGYIIAFIDCTHEMDSTARLVTICLITGVICIGILLVTVIGLSYWAVRPVEEGFKRQRQFVADASHELKTPLSVISANTSVLESTYGENQWTGYIQTEIGRMSQLINDMLGLARLEQPEMVLPMEPMDFSKTAMEVLLPYESLAYELGKQFGYKVEPGLICVGNRESLNRMLHIFVDNAFKYSGPGGEVRVTVKHSRKKIWIQVYDTGEGISKEARELIFERFYREESSHSREKEGYGLGLSIARTILERHRGKVHVQSDGKSFASFEIQL